MVLPISGLIHGFGFLSMAFVGYRFLKYGKEEKYPIGTFFGWGFFNFFK